MSYGWTVKRLERGLGLHAVAWDEVNRARMGEHPLLTSSFVDSLLRHFGDGRQFLCVLDGPSGPEAMCILQRRTMGLWTSFLPAQTQLGPLMATSQEQLRGLIEQLPGFAQAVDLLCVDPDCSPFAARTPELSPSPHAVTMNVDLARGFESYWASRSAQLRKNMRRYERRADEEGLPLRFAMSTGSRDVLAGVRRYAVLESAGWKSGQGTAISPDNEQGKFYSNLLEEFAHQGSAFVFELWLGEQLAASRLVVLSGRMFVILKTTYNESLDRFAPGRLLLRHVLEYGFSQHPGKVIEFYTDATQDQLAWATGSRQIRHWSVHRNVHVERSLAALRVLRNVVRVQPPSLETRALEAHVFTGVDSLPEDAARLLGEGEKSSLQLGPDWFNVLGKTVFKGAAVRFSVARENGACVAVLPVLARPHARHTELLALSNFYTASYAPAMRAGVKPTALVAALNALLSEFGNSARVTMAPMDPESPAYEALKTALDLSGWVTFKFFCFGNWVLQPPRTWDEYLSRRDSRMRHTIARMERRFSSEGGRIEIVQQPETLAAALQSFVQVYARSWKRAEPYPDFLPEVVRTFGPRGCLRLGLAWIGDQPAAAQLWFVAHGRAEIYKLAHDEAFKRYSPGTLLTAMMMRRAMEVDQVREVDFLAGDDPYKRDWMSLRRERWGIVAYNPRTAVGFVGMARELLARTARVWFKPEAKAHLQQAHPKHRDAG